MSRRQTPPTPVFELGVEDYLRGEPRPSHYPERARGWDTAKRVAETGGEEPLKMPPLHSKVDPI